jgi:hypothetical protein
VDERLLGRIFGAMEVAQDAMGDREQTRADLARDLGERSFVPVLSQLHDPSARPLARGDRADNSPVWLLDGRVVRDPIRRGCDVPHHRIVGPVTLEVL